MTTTTVATYIRESTLWKNANGFYHWQDWTRMECIVCDFTDDIKEIEKIGCRWIDINGNDVTEQEIEKRYGKPYCVKFINKRGTNEKCYWFKTKDEANSFVKGVLRDRILKNFKRV